MTELRYGCGCVCQVRFVLQHTSLRAAAVTGRGLRVDKSSTSTDQHQLNIRVQKVEEHRLSSQLVLVRCIPPESLRTTQLTSSSPS
jgi:hypothetical protein